ncbi:nucleotidyltransferase family protein [Foetidibacter luteolus]|uniref:nucleotidyltransferase family protein n=1 Tax=Foetidibacter luteolus TaxID=2608880 RepID=UPI00129B45D4|nr:nucleotidyltransferase family protein [Foetidibacter luteolus]
MVKKAMILAAGLGSRLKPWTDNHPKALAIVNGKSLLQRNVEYLQQYGITDIIVNVHHFAEQVIDAITISKGWGSRITISDETDEVLETGGGLKKAAWFFEGPQNFVLMNADVLTDLNLGQMAERHVQCGALATLAVSDRETSRYFLFDEQGRLSGWRNVKKGEEKPNPLPPGQLEQKAFSGLHVLSSNIFSLIQRSGKFSMVDVYLDICASQNIQCFDHSASKFIDVGKPESIAKAEALFK